MVADNKDNNIAVTVICTVYNHAPYLRKCLDGIVSQKTNFNFEAIVHDDTSTDDSAKVILEYANKYPDIIKPIIQTENQYSKHDGSLRRILQSSVRGKYVAFCEGDDYWNNTDKLQLQFDFLNSSPDVSLCFHNVNVVNKNDIPIKGKLYTHLRTKFYTADEIISTWTVPTCSALVRSECYLSVPFDKRFVVGDNVIWMNCLAMGKAFCINEKMATYRRDNNGWTLQSFGGNKLMVLASYQKYYKHLQALKEHFPNVADYEIEKSKRTYHARILIIELARFKGCAFSSFFQGMRLYGVPYLSTLFLESLNRVKIRIKRLVHS